MRILYGPIAFLALGAWWYASLPLAGASVFKGAKVLAAQGEIFEAIEAYQRGLGFSPEEGLARLDLAVLLYQRAGPAFEAWKAQRPDPFFAVDVKGSAAPVPPPEFPDLREAVRLLEENRIILQGKNLADRLAHGYASLQRHKEAFELRKYIRAYDPHFPGITAQCAHDAAALGCWLFEQGGEQDGIDVVQEELSKSDGHPSLKALKGWYRMNHREISGAEDLLRETLEKEPAFSFARYVLGKVYLVEGRGQEAIKELEKSFVLLPSGQTQAYELMYEATSRLNPSLFPEGIALLGRLALEAGHLEAAEDHFKQAVAEQTQTIEARLGLAEISERRKDYSGAMERYEGLLKDYPALGAAQEGLLRTARALRNTERFQEAVNLLESHTPRILTYATLPMPSPL